ncbi:TonB family protein [candidate division KSB1 bacterium]|nr:TonB family protein [candidate division KSB1 bacterium]
MNRINKLYQFSHCIHIEKAIIVSLLLIIVLFQTFPKKIDIEYKEPKRVVLSLTIEDIPATEQKIRRGQPAPTRPVLPVPSEDSLFPEDDTIDETNINWKLGDSPYGTSGITIGKIDTIPPRPLVQVVPEYSKELQKKKIEGNVKLLVKIDESGNVIDVVVSANTTQSEICKNAAVDAAYKSRYTPAIADNKKISMWTTCIYSFKHNE